jgi:dTDP-4-amino-4,6-dideoxygalactose transaminase
VSRLALGEVAPTAGLKPRWGDLLAAGRGPSLERAICDQLGLPDIEITSTGTAALLIAFTYLARRCPNRSRVIVPGYTCPLVVIAAAAAGLEVAACDTVAGDFDLDPDHLAKLINDRTLAVVPTHYGGALTDIGRVRAVTAAVSSEIAIIEDAAQAFGATWHGESVGLAGDIGVFSFGAGKGFTIYEGGGLVARDARTMQGLRQIADELSSSSALGEAWRAALFAGYHAFYNALGLRLVFGMPKRYWLARGDEIRAAGDKFPMSAGVNRVGGWRKRVGRAALARLPDHLARSRARFDELARRFATISGVRAHVPVPGALPTATFLFLTLPATPRSEAVIQSLWRSRLGVAKMFSRAIGDYPDLVPLMHRGETPNARAIAATTITLSTDSALSPADEAAILQALQRG